MGAERGANVLDDITEYFDIAQARTDPERRLEWINLNVVQMNVYVCKYIKNSVYA